MFLRDPDQLDVNMCAYHEKMASLRCHQTWLAGKSFFFFVGKTMPFLPAMTGNGNHATYKNGEVGDGLLFWLVVSNMNFIFHNTG